MTIQKLASMMNPKVTVRFYHSESLVILEAPAKNFTHADFSGYNREVDDFCFDLDNSGKTVLLIRVHGNNGDILDA